MERPGRGPLFYALLLGVAGGLLWLLAGPGVLMLVGSVHDGRHFTLAGWSEWFATSSAAREALFNSLWLSAASVLLAATIGVPLGYVFARYDFPGRRLLAALAIVPLLLPPLVGTLAFYFLYAPSGIVTRLVQTKLHLAHAPWHFTGFAAVLAVHAYSFYPYFYTFVAAGLARLDESRHEAAATLGASPARTFRTVTLPLLTPALVGAALLTFMQSMASFTAPIVLGGVRVLTTLLVESREQAASTSLHAETLVLTVACALFMLGLQWFEGRSRYFGGVKGSGSRRRVELRGLARVLLALVVLVAATVMLLPHAVLLLISVADNARWTTEILPRHFSGAGWQWLLAHPSGQIPLINSFAMALQATAANVVFALAAAWLFARFAFRGRGALQALALLPYAVPGTVVGLLLAQWFSVHHPALGRFVWRGTYAILPLAYFVRGLPLTVRAVQGSLAQVDPSLEAAAATLGSAPGRVLWTVVWPLVLPGALVGGCLAFVNAIGEFVASVVLWTPENRPIAIEIWNQLRGSYFDRAAGYGVLLMLFTAACLALAARLGGRRQGSSFTFM